MPLLRCIRIAALLLGSVGSGQASAGQDHPTDPARPEAISAGKHSNDYVVVPPPSQEALRFHASGNILWLINKAWGILIPCFLLFTGLSARLRSWAERLGRRWFFTLAFYFLFLWLLVYVIDWPLDYYEGYVRPHAYGLSTQSFDKWLSDSLKAWLVNLVGGWLFLWVPYLLLARSPRRWWLYTGLLTVPFLFLVMLIMPIWIDPLFNDFGPMHNKELEAKILALAQRAGIEGTHVYEVDKSVDTTALNAYVTGFLGTKRIVLWDTLLNKLEDRQILFIMGHEMGHYVLDHVVQGILFSALLVIATLAAIQWIAPPLLRRFRARWGFGQLADVASVPLIVLLVNVLALVVVPIGLAFSRHIEHEADRFGLEITQDNHAAALSFVRLQTENLAVPRPGWLYCLFRCSHPSLGDRVDFCNTYRPWETGEPLRYGRYFHGSP